MSEQTKRDSKLVEMLNEAYGKERQLEVALGLTSRGDHAGRLREGACDST